MINFDDLSVLVIDDSKFIRDTVRRILRSIGVSKIRMAPNGMAGLNMVSQDQFDIVLCDLSMEPINGMRFVEFLRKHENAKLRDLPVIILTMHNEQEIVKKAIEQGIDGYLLKPVSIKSIKERIEQVLGGESSARPATA